MATLTIACRQVWLAPTPLSETCRKMLCLVPVTPGQLFGPAAQLVLERSAHVNRLHSNMQSDQCCPPFGRAGQAPIGPHLPSAFHVPQDRTHRYGPHADCHPKPTKGREGRNSSEYLKQWKALTSDPCVLLTLSEGYSKVQWAHTD